MANSIFTRKALTDILNNEDLTADQRADRVFALYGRALDDGYIDKGAAQQAQQTALEKAREEWEKGQQPPDPKESEDYKKLMGEFEDFKTMQAARTSKAYERVKGKFFEQVYNLVDRSDGAKPVEEQLKAIEEQYAEYFTPDAQPNKPTFGAPLEGGMPKGEEGAVQAFKNAWHFAPQKK